MDMGDNKNDIPQVSFNLTVGSDRVKASVASACSTDSGGSELSLSNGEGQSNVRPIHVAGNQATKIATGTKMGEENPFKKKGIPRTPPQGERLYSCPEHLTLGEVSAPDKAKQKTKKNKNQEDGPHAQQAAIESSAETKRTQALERLEKLTSELHEFVQSKINIHKEIKTKTTSVMNALRKFKTLDEECQSLRLTSSVTQKKSSQAVTETEEAMDTGGEADGKSVAEEQRDFRSAKRKERSSPESAEIQVHKKKDVKRSPLQHMAAQDTGKKTTPAWQLVQSRKDKRKQAKDQLPKEPTRKPRPEPKRKKLRKWTRPDALRIRPAEKANYAEIFCRIKKDVPGEQVCDTVDKIRKTRDGNMLITLSRKSNDKGQALQKTIASILQEEAEVISKVPQEQLEIRDLDDTTTAGDVRAALQKAAGDSYEILIEAIKIRPAYRGTQLALVTLPTATAQTVLGERGKIKIGWVNCRVRAVKKPQPCFKCWHYGHLAVQCKSEVNRSKLCIKCGQTGHQVAKCPNKAKCMLCAGKSGLPDTAHRAGSSQCPIFKEALQKITNIRA